jgi:hypothetical protein
MCDIVAMMTPYMDGILIYYHDGIMEIIQDDLTITVDLPPGFDLDDRGEYTYQAMHSIAKAVLEEHRRM